MRNNKKRILSLALAVVLALSVFTGCEAKPKQAKFNGTIWDSFDTIISIVSFNDNEEQFNDFMKIARERYSYYHKLQQLP